MKAEDLLTDTVSMDFDQERAWESWKEIHTLIRMWLLMVDKIEQACINY